MNSNLMIDAISHLDGEVIEHFFQIKSQLENERKKKKFVTPLKWASAAACLVVVASVSVWLFVPMESGEDSANYYSIEKDGMYVHYDEVSNLSRFETFMLKNKIGELYFEKDGNMLYTVKGSDDLEYLIWRKPDGELSMLQFRQFFPDKQDDISLGYIFESIYNLKSYSDVKEIVFEKNELRNDTIGKKVDVKRVTITDSESIERILSIFKSLEYGEHFSYTVISSHDSRYESGEMPLSAQTERKITIKLTDGDDVKIHFNPIGNCVMMNGTKYGSISEEDRDWLVDIAGIDMEYHFYGVMEEAEGETTSPPEVE